MKNIAEKIDYGRYAFTSTVIMESVFSDLIKNNTYIPCINRAIYNLGKKAYPKLDENGKRIRKTGPDGMPIKQLPKASGKQLREQALSAQCCFSTARFTRSFSALCRDCLSVC
jgi:hypothetical protein